MAKKELALFDQYSNMNNELKRLEDAYVKKSVQYEKVYQAALSSVSICRKHGISNEYFIQVRVHGSEVGIVILPSLLIFHFLSRWQIWKLQSPRQLACLRDGIP